MSLFQELENKANGTLDYSQLNRELSATGATFSPGTGIGHVIPISDDSGDSVYLRPAVQQDGDVSMDREVTFIDNNNDMKLCILAFQYSVFELS